MGVPYAEVIGDPIAHSKSPLIHNFWLGKMGIDAEYRAMRVPTDGLGEYFRDRLADEDWRGCNISMPLKLAARAFAHHRQDPSFPPWPINLAYRAADGTLQGEEFDSSGFIMSLLKMRDRFPVEPGRPPTALVLGAGSAALLVVWGLAHFGCSEIWIRNRDIARAERLVAETYRVGTRVLPVGAPTPGVDILVNATPLGMSGQPEADVDIDPLCAHAIVYDLVYVPAETGLLRRARERGLLTINGLSMLVEQAAPSFRRFFGVMPPRQHDEELRELLNR
jgi:shikimate dehydrogenase